MLKILAMTASVGLAMLGCAGQSPSDQLTRPSTVRVCQGASCVDQDRNTVTF